MSETRLTKDELVLLINLLGQTQVRVVDAPKLIELSNKLSKMADETK